MKIVISDCSWNAYDMEKKRICPQMRRLSVLRFAQRKTFLRSARTQMPACPSMAPIPAVCWSSCPI